MNQNSSKNKLIRTSAIIALVTGCALFLAACSSSSEPAATDTSTGNGTSEQTAAAPVTIGAFNFTESMILAELYAGVLREQGVEVGIQQSTNREVLEQALESNEVQIVPEYIGTFTEFLNAKQNGPDATALASGDLAATLAEAQKLANKVGITLLTPSQAADQNAFAITAAFADENGLVSLSDLSALSKENPIILGGPPECPERPFCQVGLVDVYGMQIGEFVPLDAGGPLTKQALADGKINLGLVFSSDGGVADLNLRVLADDLALQQVDNIVPAVNTSAVTPTISAALDSLSAALTTDDLIALNKAVDIDRKNVADVAAEFLRTKGLIS